uniref:Uncharacterized protein n=1 Tax=Anguilla anguilla TaxID=7936 RepID=A0A0E9QWJ7_ANGAN
MNMYTKRQNTFVV